MIIGIAMKRGRKRAKTNDSLFAESLCLSPFDAMVVRMLESMWVEIEIENEIVPQTFLRLCHSTKNRRFGIATAAFYTLHTFCTHTAQARRPSQTQHALHVACAMCEMRIHTPQRNVQPKGKCHTYTHSQPCLNEWMRQRSGGLTQGYVGMHYFTENANEKLPKKDEFLPMIWSFPFYLRQKWQWQLFHWILSMC